MRTSAPHSSNMASERRGEPPTCLVTVGTTEFDALVSALEAGAADVVGALRRCGFGRLVVQFGRGSVEPAALRREARAAGLAFESFRLSDRFGPYVEAASLVVSHAGAGSILEALRARKALLVVVNETLMGNHQVELASALEELGHLRWAPPADTVAVLCDVLRQGAKPSRPFPPADREAFPLLLERELGFR